MDKKPIVAELLAEMVENNASHWARGGQKNVLVPLFEKILEIKNYSWDKGHDALARTIYTFGIDGDSLGITELMKKIRKVSFKTQLNEVEYRLLGKYYLDDKEKKELSEKLFSSLADDFLNNVVYLNVEEVKSLLEKTGYIPIDFVKYLETKATDEQLESLFNTIINVIELKLDTFYSPFLGCISSYSKNRKPLVIFLNLLRDSGKEYLYVSLMAGTENNELGHFKQLISEQKSEILKSDFLPIYLQFFRSYGNEHFLMMLKALRDCFPDRPNDLISYVGAERFLMLKDEHPEVISIVKWALLNYKIEDDNGRMLSDYTQILIETLQYWHDVDFAKKINRKFIGVYNTPMVHFSTEGVYTELFKDYIDDIWPEFIKAFLGPDSFWFYYQVKDELGSGFGFGKGPLFDVKEELIKQICMEHPESAPTRIAAMVPCFESDANGKDTEQFNKWITWLLDNFGEQKDVRDGISSNLGSFSWVGKISIYYERNIKCFEKLLNHSKQEVREWARECINEEKKLLDIEKNKKTL